MTRTKLVGWATELLEIMFYYVLGMRSRSDTIIHLKAFVTKLWAQLEIET